MSAVSLTEYIAKLRRMTEGALAACEREHRPEQRERSKQWWDGYRQCLADIEHAAKENRWMTTP